jgi:hypothetical protein
VRTVEQVQRSSRTGRALAAVAAVLALIAFVVLVRPFSNGDDTIPVPYTADPARTPGVLNPEVTQATIGRTICERGWTGTIRPPSSYTSDLKRRQMAEYGSRGGPADYQEDHLISLELGGHPTDPRNFWPEPRPRAEQVDALENELNDRICDGSLSLADAQQRIRREKFEKG